MAPAYDINAGEAEAWEHLTADLEEELGQDASAFVLLDMSRNGSPIVYASAQMNQLFGFEDTELLGQPWTILCGDETDVDDMRTLESAVYSTEECSRCLVCQKQTGERFWNHIYLEPGSMFSVPFTCLSCHDVTHLVEGQATDGSIDIAAEASRIQSIQMSTVKTALNIMKALVMASREGDELENGQEPDSHASEAMQAIKTSLTNNNFEEIRRLLLDTDGAIASAMELRASFSLVINDNGQERTVTVHQGNALHYAVCRSAFYAAVALMIAAPDLITAECHWNEEGADDGDDQSPMNRLRRFSPVQLANRYGEFFEETNADLSQLYFAVASVMQYFEQLTDKMDFMSGETPMQRLRSIQISGDYVLVELMRLASSAIIEEEEVGTGRSGPQRFVRSRRH
eukprot:767755-Hanusia_phi.AAC.4